MHACRPSFIDRCLITLHPSAADGISDFRVEESKKKFSKSEGNKSLSDTYVDYDQEMSEWRRRRKLRHNKRSEMCGDRNRVKATSSRLPMQIHVHVTSKISGRARRVRV